MEGYRGKGTTLILTTWGKLRHSWSEYSLRGSTVGCLESKVRPSKMGESSAKIGAHNCFCGKAEYEQHASKRLSWFGWKFRPNFVIDDSVQRFRVANMWSYSISRKLYWLFCGNNDLFFIVFGWWHRKSTQLHRWWQEKCCCVAVAQQAERRWTDYK